jgi:hypothetical protein
MSQQYPTQAKFQAFLSRSGESVPDLLLKLKLDRSFCRSSRPTPTASSN